jgi:hypothetical protein
MNNQQVVLDFLDAFGTYDPDKFFPFMTDDPTWRVFLLPGALAPA